MKASRWLHALAVWLLALTTLLSLTTAGSAAAADPFADFRYSQPIDVERAGWVAVELGAQATAHVGDLRLYGPDGLAVPMRLAPDRRSRRSADVVEVTNDGSSWLLDLDLGEAPPAHDQLAFRFVRKVTASGVELEASDDQRSWRHIASANLFRLGSGTGLERQTIYYPPTSTRFLRLRWPATAGTPELESASVRAAGVSGAGGASGGQPVDADCRQESASALICRLPLPQLSELVERLEVEVDSGGAGPYDVHLLVGDAGRWRSVGQVEARGRARKSFGLGVSPGAAFAQLEVRGDALRFVSASVYSARRTVLFEASSAGRYTLAFGHVESGSGSVLSSALSSAPALPERVQWLRAGELVSRPELAKRLAVEPATSARREAEVGHVVERWRVVAGDVRTGAPVQLEVPTVSWQETQRLHLINGKWLVPFVVERQAEPRLIERWLESPTSEVRDGVAVWRLESSAGSGIDELVLRASGPFERRVVVSWQEQPAIAGRDPRLHTLHRGAWSCQRLPALPCEVRLELEPWRGQQLTVSVTGGEIDGLGNEPMEIEHWQSIDRLLFAWPGESTELVLGDRRSKSAGQPAPRASRLLGSTPRATVGLDAVAPPIDAPAWLWPSVAAAAAIAMFWLLARQVDRSDSASRPKEQR